MLQLSHYGTDPYNITKHRYMHSISKRDRSAFDDLKEPNDALAFDGCNKVIDNSASATLQRYLTINCGIYARRNGEFLEFDKRT